MQFLRSVGGLRGFLSQRDQLLGKGTESLGPCKRRLNALMRKKRRGHGGHDCFAVLFFNAELVAMFLVAHKR